MDERAIVNGIVGLLATGGSTNHTLHLVAIAHAAGIVINWDDFSDLSAVVPLLAHIYPNGQADVNHFHAAGGMGFLIGELLAAGLLHGDVLTVAGEGLARYREEPVLDNGALAWRPAPQQSGDETRVASGRRAVQSRRRTEAAQRQSRPGGHQDLGGEARTSSRGSARPGL